MAPEGNMGQATYSSSHRDPATPMDRQPHYVAQLVAETGNLGVWLCMWRGLRVDTASPDMEGGWGLNAPQPVQPQAARFFAFPPRCDQQIFHWLIHL